MSKAVLANNKSISINKYVGSGTLNFNSNGENSSLVTATSDEYLLCNYLYLLRVGGGSGVGGLVTVIDNTTSTSLLTVYNPSPSPSVNYEFKGLEELLNGTGKKLLIPPGSSLNLNVIIAGGAAGTYSIQYKYSFTRFVNSPS